MTLAELYEAVGGDYSNVLERLGDKQTIQKFVLKFSDDSTYDRLLRYLREKDMKHAFYEAHTLKGITLSLGFDRLGSCVGTLCENLRNETAPSEILLQQLKTEFQCVNTAINDLKNCI